ncbi:MAG: MFS transporter [Gammaproteobacteria bacterium]|nr:MAG: MFS transporter [Gammaproteobacteria bacterium]
MVYTRLRVIAMLFLGFSAGLPFLLVFSTLSAWLTDAQISRSIIGLFSWVGITYSIKVFWAPVVDRVPLLLLTRYFGKRRSWMLLAQTGIAVGLLGMSRITPGSDTLTMMVWFALLVAFSSATQDITIDAYRIEAIEVDKQAAMAAMYIGGYRLALLVAGAGAFYIADFFSWQSAYMAMAVLVSVGIITTLIINEPAHIASQNNLAMEARVIAYMERSAHLPDQIRRISAWFIGAVVCPFVDFFSRNGVLAILILVLVAVFRISDITMGVMANPFYLDMGFSKSEIASVAKVFGFAMTILGSVIGGVLVLRFGIMRILLLGAAMVASTNLLFAMMAASDPGLGLLSVVISADNLSGGIANAVFIAYLSSLVNQRYTATQYALFSSLMTLPGKFLGGFSGFIVDGFGYVSFFLYASAAGLPAIILILYLMNRDTSDA